MPAVLRSRQALLLGLAAVAVLGAWSLRPGPAAAGPVVVSEWRSISCTDGKWTATGRYELASLASDPTTSWVVEGSGALRDPGDDLATQRGWVAGARVLELWGGVEPVGADRVRLWATAVVSLPGGGRTELACARTAPAA
jgi:hypothetical protein